MIDPKKALATRDGDEIEEIGGALQLVHLAASPGSTPDGLASVLQRSQWKYELALLFFPAMVLTSGSIRTFGEASVMLYFLFLWPALGLSLAWSPLRSNSNRAPVRDTLFVGFAYAQSLALGVILAQPLGEIVSLLLSSFGFHRGWILDLPVFWSIFVFGAWIVGRNLSESLVERELETLPDSNLPSVDELRDAELELSGAKSFQSLLGTTFRAAGWALLASAPYILTSASSWAPRARPSWAALWWAVCAGIGIQHLARGVFYLTMSRQMVRSLKERRKRLLETANDSKAMVAIQAEQASWKAVRTVPGALQTWAYGSVFGAFLGFLKFHGYYLVRLRPEAPTFLGWAGSFAVLAMLSSWAIPKGEDSVASMPRRVLQGLQAMTLPALFFLGILWVASVRPYLGWNFERILDGALLLAFFPVVDRLLALWAHRYQKALPGTPDTPSSLSFFQPNFSIIRRSVFFIVASLGLMIATESALRKFGWSYSTRQIWETFLMGTGFGASALFAMRSYVSIESSGRSEGQPLLLETEAPPPLEQIEPDIALAISDFP